MTITSDFFNFESIKQRLGNDPFAQETNQYKSDPRFYTLPKDENGKGLAVIAFLPDPNLMMKKVYRINSNFTKDGKRRFVSEFSPSTINLPDPFQETWAMYYNQGDVENARKYGRSIKYITNIRIINDPKKPENNGKVFLYELGSKLFDKIRSAMDPSSDELALGTKRLEIYNPLAGIYFKLRSVRGSNGFINYDSSEFSTAKPMFDNAEEAFKYCEANCYKLSEFDDPKTYKSYDELKKLLEWVSFSNSQNNTVKVADPEAPKPEIKDAGVSSPIHEPVKPMNETANAGSAKSADTSIDDLLNDLI